MGDGQILKCGNSAAEFIISRTAVPTYFDGQLTFSGQDETVALSCRQITPARNSNIPSEPWSCVEKRNGEGRYSVSVTSGGFVGLKMAHVSMAQMYPLPSESIATLICE